MSRPHIGKSAFNQDKAGAAEEASEEATDGQCRKAFGIPGTEDEKGENRQTNEVDWRTAELLTKVGGGDGRK